MNIAYFIDPKDNSAIPRRRLLALIPEWQRFGHKVFEWSKNSDFDVIYILNLPLSIDHARKIFASKKKNQAFVVGMIEDFDTRQWAAICDEQIDTIYELIKINKKENKTITGNLRKLRDWLGQLGMFNPWHKKVIKLLKNADAIISTSELQAAGLRKYNPYVTGIADCIPTNEYDINSQAFQTLCERKNKSNSIILVWEGTQWGLQLLELIREPLNKIIKDSNIKIILRLIMPRYRSDFFGKNDNKEIAKDRFLCEVEHYDWDIKTAGTLIKSSDIGLAPMPMQNPFYRAKAFSKPLVYMSLGLPVIASSIPSYRELIQNGINSYLVDNNQVWFEILSKLIKDKELRLRIGKMAEIRVAEFHSVEIVAKKFIDVFQNAYKIRTA
jgi:hypothetical protein